MKKVSGLNKSLSRVKHEWIVRYCVPSHWKAKVSIPLCIFVSTHAYSVGKLMTQNFWFVKSKHQVFYW